MKLYPALAILILSLAASLARADTPIASKTLKVDGINLHYLTAGTAPETVILIHGYAQSSLMWRAGAIPELSKRFTVIAPDLPGFGDSDIPSDGLDMKSAAIRIHDLAKALHVTKARVVGHDIGLMVAYAYASMYPSETEKLVLMDAFLPGVGDWESTYHDPTLWHFTFHGPTPEALVKGRERIYFEHFWNDFAADGKHSLTEADRRHYTADYARPGRMRAGWAYFAAFPQTAKEFAVFAKTPLPMPVLVIAGGKSGGDGLVQQVKLVAKTVVPVVLAASGHWVLDEQPAETLAALARFL
ncbi:MAG TPA: alpha/beta hydrolase [Kofleriaceae bacterium]|jgi:pimeloyl-ACP methyl ester carboxylesterase